MIRKVIDFLNWLLTKLTWISVVLAGFMMLIMVFTTCYGVAMRYFFRKPSPISYEITTILMLWAFLFAIAYVEQRKEHIRADIFVSLMPTGLANFLSRIVGPTLGLIYCVILTWKGWGVAMYSLSIGEKSMSVWAEPLFPVKLMVPLCYGLLSLVVLRNLVQGIDKYISHN